MELSGAARDLLLKRVEAEPCLLSDWVLPIWSQDTVAGNRINLYDGRLRMIDESGAMRAEYEASAYADHLVESTLDWSYMKPVHAMEGAERFQYRVGPLARINTADSISTPLADRELASFRTSFGRPAHATVLQTYARLIELIYAIERAREIVRDPDLGGPTRVAVKLRAGRVVGHVEAPRGTLFHDYEIDDQGVVRANLLVATQQNYAAINASIAPATANCSTPWSSPSAATIPVFPAPRMLSAGCRWR
jgi:F420-non-reducing hydrogenase large subunit